MFGTVTISIWIFYGFIFYYKNDFFFLFFFSFFESMWMCMCEIFWINICVIFCSCCCCCCYIINVEIVKAPVNGNPTQLLFPFKYRKFIYLGIVISAAVTQLHHGHNGVHSFSVFFFFFILQCNFEFTLVVAVVIALSNVKVLMHFFLRRPSEL